MLRPEVVLGLLFQVWTVGAEAGQVLGSHGKAAAMLGNEAALGHSPWGKGLWSNLSRMVSKRMNLVWVGVRWMGWEGPQCGETREASSG